ncbi:ammonium transporter [Tsuneonella sp. HG094]
MNTEIRSSLVWGAGIIGLALIASGAQSAGAIATETSTRIVLAAIGLMVAWYGNRMPKAFLPDTAARRIARVGGWAMAISGLVNAAFYAFADLDVAIVGGTAAIAAGMAIMIGYCLATRRGLPST